MMSSVVTLAMAAVDVSLGAGAPNVQSESTMSKSNVSGGALLLVIGEPFTADHKELILERITKGLGTWDNETSGCDLDAELQTLATEAPLGEEGPNGERVVQHESAILNAVILINPQLETVRNKLRSLFMQPVQHRHLVYAGHAIQGTGDWVLQDDIFTFDHFSAIAHEADVVNALKQSGSAAFDIHCFPQRDWSEAHMKKLSLAKLQDVHVNPETKLQDSAGVVQLANYVAQFIRARPIKELLQASDVVGNIRFSRPTLYIFPGSQGDSSLFGISGFNLLVNGGYNKKACFWDFTRHLDRIDAVLMTHLGSDNLFGISSVFERKAEENVHPEIGHVYFNAIEKSSKHSPDGESPPENGGSHKPAGLLVNLSEEGSKLVSNLKNMGQIAHPCVGTVSGHTMPPINLYHKVGHGSLDLYVLNPMQDSKELKDFFSQWNKHVSNFTSSKSNKLSVPLPNCVSISALLVWKPADPSEKVTRLLFPGSTPQQKVFDGLDKLKDVEMFHHPVYSSKIVHGSKLTKKGGKPTARVPPSKATTPPGGKTERKATTPRTERKAATRLGFAAKPAKEAKNSKKVAVKEKKSPREKPTEEISESTTPSDTKSTASTEVAGPILSSPLTPTETAPVAMEPTEPELPKEIPAEPKLEQPVIPVEQDIGSEEPSMESAEEDLLGSIPGQVPETEAVQDEQVNVEVPPPADESVPDESFIQQAAVEQEQEAKPEADQELIPGLTAGSQTAPILESPEPLPDPSQLESVPLDQKQTDFMSTAEKPEDEQVGYAESNRKQLEELGIYDDNEKDIDTSEQIPEAFKDETAFNKENNLEELGVYEEPEAERTEVQEVESMPPAEDIHTELHDQPESMQMRSPSPDFARESPDIPAAQEFGDRLSDTAEADQQLREFESPISASPDIASHSPAPAEEDQKEEEPEPTQRPDSSPDLGERTPETASPDFGEHPRDELEVESPVNLPVNDTLTTQRESGEPEAEQVFGGAAPEGLPSPREPELLFGADQPIDYLSNLEEKALETPVAERERQPEDHFESQQEQLTDNVEDKPKEMFARSDEELTDEELSERNIESPVMEERAQAEEAMPKDNEQIERGMPEGIVTAPLPDSVEEKQDFRMDEGFGSHPVEEQVHADEYGPEDNQQPGSLPEDAPGVMFGSPPVDEQVHTDEYGPDDNQQPGSLPEDAPGVMFGSPPVDEQVHTDEYGPDDNQQPGSLPEDAPGVMFGSPPVDEQVHTDEYGPEDNQQPGSLSEDAPGVMFGSPPVDEQVHTDEYGPEDNQQPGSLSEDAPGVMFGSAPAGQPQPDLLGDMEKDIKQEDSLERDREQDSSVQAMDYSQESFPYDQAEEERRVPSESSQSPIDAAVLQTEQISESMGTTEAELPQADDGQDLLGSCAGYEPLAIPEAEYPPVEKQQDLLGVEHPPQQQSEPELIPYEESDLKPEGSVSSSGGQQDVLEQPREVGFSPESLPSDGVRDDVRLDAYQDRVPSAEDAGVMEPEQQAYGADITEADVSEQPREVGFTPESLSDGVRDDVRVDEFQDRVSSPEDAMEPAQQAYSADITETDRPPSPPGVADFEVDREQFGSSSLKADVSDSDVIVQPDVDKDLNDSQLRHTTEPAEGLGHEEEMGATGDVGGFAGETQMTSAGEVETGSPSPYGDDRGYQEFHQEQLEGQQDPEGHVDQIERTASSASSTSSQEMCGYNMQRDPLTQEPAGIDQYGFVDGPRQESDSTQYPPTNPFLGVSDKDVAQQPHVSDPFNIPEPNEAIGAAADPFAIPQDFMQREVERDSLEREEAGETFDPVQSWGHPMGLPAPEPKKGVKTEKKSPTKPESASASATKRSPTKDAKTKNGPTKTTAKRPEMKTASPAKSSSAGARKPASAPAATTRTTTRKAAAPAAKKPEPKKEKKDEKKPAANGAPAKASTPTRKARPQTVPSLTKTATKPATSRLDKTTKTEPRVASKLASKKSATATSKAETVAKAAPLAPVTPFYVDLTYIPNHGNANYVDLDFFRRVRARYYVISSLNPQPAVLNALLTAKATWEDPSLEVTLIPTYDTDTLRQWMGLHREKLGESKIDIAPAANRCTIQLQDHETSCSAYRLEF